MAMLPPPAKVTNFEQARPDIVFILVKMKIRAKVQKASALEEMTSLMKTLMKVMRWTFALFATALVSNTLPQQMASQDQRGQDDPPSRVARLGYMQGSISFQPAGESEWVEAAQNRHLTTGDKLWADKDSRAELQLGSAVMNVNSNTGFSFLNL